MFRYAFKEFEDSTSQKSYSEDQPQCKLDDSMFVCFIHWYTKPNEQHLQGEKRALEKLAEQFNAVLCYWRIVTEDDERFNMIDIKAIQDVNKLPQFLGQALEVSRATVIRKKFRVLSICIINRFGSFQAEKCYSLCPTCRQEERLNECCAQFTCAKCEKGTGEGSCPYCNKKLEVSTISLQTVGACQSKHIYQPMLPYLSLEQRFELMDIIQSEIEYN